MWKHRLGYRRPPTSAADLPPNTGSKTCCRQLRMKMRPIRQASRSRTRPQSRNRLRSRYRTGSHSRSLIGTQAGDEINSSKRQNVSTRSGWTQTQPTKWMTYRPSAEAFHRARKRRHHNGAHRSQLDRSALHDHGVSLSDHSRIAEQAVTHQAERHPNEKSHPKPVPISVHINHGMALTSRRPTSSVVGQRRPTSALRLSQRRHVHVSLSHQAATRRSSHA